jgi:two-component system sensor histidine kinase PhoQ
MLLFFGVTIVVLDTAFRKAGEQAQEDILDGHLMALLAAAEPNNSGELGMPPDMHEPRFGNIGSGLYAELRDSDRGTVWQSQSALGLTIPVGSVPADGTRLFLTEALSDGTPLLTLSLAVQWEFPDGQLRPYVFKVAESLDSFNAQIARFRRQLFSWFAAVALVMLLSISILLRGLLRPLRQIETEIGEVEEGKRTSLSGSFPTELIGVARNLNLLIDSERARSDRYRNTLDNLAHSLKTPLAAMRALLSEQQSRGSGDRFSDRYDAQIDRMDEIVRYQLRKPASLASSKLAMSHIDVAAEIKRLVDGLRKVYRDKEPLIQVDISPGMRFRGDTGDFLELAGNLLDNACKWCEGQVRMSVHPESSAGGMVLSVADDGPGIPADAAGELLQRGTRLDESTPGHGIGLAVVKEIAESYGGQLSISKANIGGAEIIVRIPSIRHAPSA